MSSSRAFLLLQGGALAAAARSVLLGGGGRQTAACLPPSWRLQQALLGSDRRAWSSSSPPPSTTAVAGSQLVGSDASTTATTTSSSSSSGEEGPDGYRLAYEGFFARPHTRLKYASLLNTFASFAAAPYVLTCSTASPVARVAVAVSVLAFAVITTGGLHFFTKPYVHQLAYNAATDTARARMLTFFGGTRWFEFPVADVAPPNTYHPLASFQVKGRTLYVDPAAFGDAALLKRLVPAQQQEEDGSGGGDAGGGKDGSSSSSSSAAQEPRAGDGS